MALWIVKRNDGLHFMEKDEFLDYLDSKLSNEEMIEIVRENELELIGETDKEVIKSRTETMEKYIRLLAERGIEYQYRYK